MFEGSSKLAPGQYSKMMTRLGGDPNAFTAPDATFFPVTLPADRLEVVLEIMADSMVSATLGEAVFARELEVVKAERREHVANIPLSLARERSTMLANSRSPYATPTIGHPADLEHLDIAAVRAWYKDWYQPNNATLVVVGDSDLQTVRTLVERHFGSIARASLPERWTAQRNTHFRHRCQTIAAPGLRPGAILAFNTPSLATAASPSQAQALRLIPQLLANGSSSRLYLRKVRDEALLLHVHADYQPLQRGDSLLTFELAANLEKATTQSAAEAVLQEIERLRSSAPSAEELTRAKNRLLAGLVFDRDDIAKQAQAIGWHAVTGVDPRLIDQQPQEIEQVTAEDVRAAAHEFLNHERLTITYLQDEPANPTPAAEIIRDDSQPALGSLQGLDLTRTVLAAPAVQAWQTDEGAHVRLVQAHGVPMVDLVLSFDAGSRLDAGKPGLAALTLFMLDEGTHGLDAGQFAEHIEQLGAIYRKDIKIDRAIISLRSMKGSVLEPAVDLITDMVARPAMNAAQLIALKANLLASNRHQQAYPILRARQAAFAHLYGNHPYGAPVRGTAEGIEAISTQDLADFHQKAYSANNLQISLVGDLTRNEAEALCQRICQALPQHWASTKPAHLPAFESAHLALEHKGLSDTLLMLMPATAIPGDPDHPALLLANHVLGEGIDSRLYTRLRQRQGLTYSITSGLSSLNKLLYIEWEVAAGLQEASQKQVEEVLHTYMSEGPSAAELDLARQAVLGELRRKLARNGALAKLIAEHGHLGLPADALPTYIDQLLAVTPEMAHAAFKSHVDPSRTLIVSVGPTADQ
nr:peptidase M16 domain-containing protein [Pseudomonas plecoglossicida NB2011]